MLNQFYFYFHQGRTALRKSILTLIAIGLAVSMISGANYYIDSYQRQLLDESFDNIFDFSFLEYTNGLETDIGLNDDTRDELERILIDQDFTYQELTPFLRIPNNYNFNATFLSQSHSLDYHLFDPNFFRSPRFQDFFYILEGTSPESDEEIMVSYDFAQHFNLSVGQAWNINYNTSDYIQEIYNSTFEYQLNFTISGLYMPVVSQLRISWNWFGFNAYYNPENESIIRESTKYDEYGNQLVFSALSRKDSDDAWKIHPIQRMVHFWKTQSNQLPDDLQISIRDYIYGFTGIMDRSQISYRNNMNRVRIYSKQRQLITTNLRNENFYYTNMNFYLLNNLQNFVEEIRLLRIVLQIFNIPIVMSAFYIAFFSIRMNTNERQQEFLLLRSKGIPRKMIRRQFLMQSSLIGLISAAIGLVGGVGMFYIVNSIFDGIISMVLNSIVQLRISLYSIIYTITLSLLLMIISSIPSIRFINKKETNQLLSTIGEENLDVEYDEISLFTKKKKNEITLEDTPFLRSKTTRNQGDQIVEKDIGQKNNQKRNGKKKFKRKNTTKVYQNQIKKKEKKIRKFGIYLIIFSLIPLIIYLITLFSQLSIAPDGLVIFVEEELLPRYGFMYIFAIFSPILLVYGLVRFFVKENPSRFAHITRKVAHPFVKGKDFLVSLDMIKQRAYIRFMVICGIFCSLFVFSNLFLHSLEAYDTIENNFGAGADVKKSINEQLYLPDDYTNPLSPYNISERDALISSFMNDKNESFIQNSATYLELKQTREQDETYRYIQESHIYIDIQKYFDMITENGKRIPNKEFSEKINQISNYYADNTHTYPGVIVTEGFNEIYDAKEGDSIQIVDYYYNSDTDNITSITQTVEILCILPFLPGLHGGENFWGWSSHFGILLNVSEFPAFYGAIDFDYRNQESEYYTSWFDQNCQVGHLLDMDDQVMNNLTKVELYLDEIDFDWYDGVWIEIYHNDHFQEDENIGYNDQLTLFYNLIYIEFFIIGGILAMTLSLITLGIQRQNKYINGVYLSRGIGWKGLLKLIITQISIVFVISLSFGIIGGIFAGNLLLHIYSKVEFRYPSVNLPIFFQGWQIVILIGSIVSLTYLIYLIVFYFETRKNIREYFPQF